MVSLYQYKIAMKTMEIQHCINYFPDQENVLWVDSAPTKKLQHQCCRTQRQEKTEWTPQVCYNPHKNLEHKVECCKQSIVVGSYFRHLINWKTHTRTRLCVKSPHCSKCITFLKQILFSFLAIHDAPTRWLIINPWSFLCRQPWDVSVTFRPAMFVSTALGFSIEKKKYKCFLFVDDESLLFAVAHYCTL